MTKSYVFGLLKHLRQFGWSSSKDLWEMLDRSRGRFLSPVMSDEDGVDMVESVLAELASLAVVHRSGDGWLLGSESTSAASAGAVASEGQGIVPPRLPPEGGDNGDGAGGNLGEVLQHPVLFSLSREDFESAVDRALSVAG
jgi:hypothetical protein